MNLSQLYYFSKLSELEHFSKAAKELYITQPSLSHAIKSLETELGVQLFEREGRRMRLTAFGKEFATYVKRGLREIDKGVERAQEFNGKLGGTVNIGAVLTVQGDYLPPLFHDFSENYGKEVKLNMFQGFSIPLVEGLENDKYDVVFAAAREQKPNLCYVPAPTAQGQTRTIVSPSRRGIAPKAASRAGDRPEAALLAQLIPWPRRALAQAVP